MRDTAERRLQMSGKHPVHLRVIAGNTA